MMNINIDEIKQLIPHREPFLFVDNCRIIVLGEEGVGDRIFRDNEYFFKGHFPNMPIVPGVVLIECMAQTAGIVVSKKYEKYKEKSVLFMSVNKAKFRKPVFPNDKVFSNVNALRSKGRVWKFQGFLKNESDELIAESQWCATIMDKDRK